ncbi:hypothetical protein WR25_11227 [Diploscapter pachys]|uniref:MIR domain-containing protein n=1 Tax=Diploscapter pachys TaxID=2018661 RepID=A0A2A2KER9_9BILA|nr:hypothetical protein WR25_11227 [Diploscapter pachys]
MRFGASVSLLLVFLPFLRADDPVTCASVIKLANNNEGVRLHSHDVKYGSGSGQQSITAVKNSDDVNSHWQIFPALNEECNRGEPIKCGQKIRLKHLSTGCFLHSHHFHAPLTKYHQEVSCFGGESDSDTGDNWKVECDGEEWTEEEAIQLKHVDTKVYLAVSGQQFGRPINGQREVAGTEGKTNGGYWKAAEGIYMGASDKSEH